MPKRPRATSNDQLFDLLTLLLPTHLSPATDRSEKIAVIGAGAAGINSTIQLLLRGKYVHLFERGQPISLEEGSLNLLTKNGISSNNPGRSSIAGLHYPDIMTVLLLLRKNSRSQWLQFKIMKYAAQIELFVQYLDAQIPSIDDDSDSMIDDDSDSMIEYIKTKIGEDEEGAHKLKVAYGLKMLISEGEDVFGSFSKTDQDSRYAIELINSFNAGLDQKDDIKRIAQERYASTNRQGPHLRNLYCVIPIKHQDAERNKRTILTTEANIAIGRWSMAVLASKSQSDKYQKTSESASKAISDLQIQSNILDLMKKAVAAFNLFAVNEITLQNPDSDDIAREGQLRTKFDNMWDDVVTMIGGQTPHHEEKMNFVRSCYPKIDGICGDVTDWAHRLSESELRAHKEKKIISEKTTHAYSAYAERQWDPNCVYRELSRFLKFFKNAGLLYCNYGADVHAIQPDVTTSGVSMQQVGFSFQQGDRSARVTVNGFHHVLVTCYDNSKHFLAQQPAVSSSSSITSTVTSTSSQAPDGSPERVTSSYRKKLIVEIEDPRLKETVPIMFIFGRSGAMITPLGTGIVGITHVADTNVCEADHTSGGENASMSFKLCKPYYDEFVKVVPQNELVKSILHYTQEGNKEQVCALYHRAVATKFGQEEEYCLNILESIYVQLIGLLPSRNHSNRYSFDAFKKSVFSITNLLINIGVKKIIRNAAEHFPWLDKYVAMLDNLELNKAYNNVTLRVRTGSVVNKGSSNTAEADPGAGFNKRDDLLYYRDPERAVSYLLAAKASTAPSDAEVAVGEVSKLLVKVARVIRNAELAAQQRYQAIIKRRSKSSSTQLRMFTSTLPIPSSSSSNSSSLMPSTMPTTRLLAQLREKYYKYIAIRYRRIDLLHTNPDFRRFLTKMKQDETDEQKGSRRVFRLIVEVRDINPSRSGNNTNTTPSVFFADRGSPDFLACMTPVDESTPTPRDPLTVGVGVGGR
jgi:hypothetical protein